MADEHHTLHHNNVLMTSTLTLNLPLPRQHMDRFRKSFVPKSVKLFNYFFRNVKCKIDTWIRCTKCLACNIVEMEYIFECFLYLHNEFQPGEISNCIAYYMTIKFILSLSYLILVFQRKGEKRREEKRREGGDKRGEERMGGTPVRTVRY